MSHTLFKSQCDLPNGSIFNDGLILMGIAMMIFLGSGHLKAPFGSLRQTNSLFFRDSNFGFRGLLIVIAYHECNTSVLGDSKTVFL